MINQGADETPSAGLRDFRFHQEIQPPIDLDYNETG